jgi:predicted short-subunit dehydrogenase-like oxidoreductase (DUF2520 family)
MNITIIGTGNVGTVLGRMLNHAGHNITMLKGRGSHEISDAHLIIVAISDDALPALKQILKLNNQLVAHTAGSVSIDVLKDISGNYGVFYPLQSIRKEMSENPEIPLLIDANTEENKLILTNLAESISNKVGYANDEQRKKLHLAAVLTSNFSNHLFALTEEYCKKEDIDFTILQPLLLETVTRLKNNSAAAVQTGPAARNDVQTIQKQRDMLSAYPQLLKLYNLFTESIINYRSSSNF